MTSEDRDLVRHLLTRQRVLALAVIVDGTPYASQLPFAVRADFGALWIHASGLARHTRGLTPDAPFAALIQQADTGEGDPFQLARLTLRGRARRVDRDDATYAEARNRFTEKLPTSLPTFGLGDFALYELVLEDGRLVAGFGRAYGLSLRVLHELAAG